MRAISTSLLLLFSSLVFAQQHYLLVGTYDSPKSEGIYVFSFDTASAVTKEIGHVKTPNPSFLTVTKDGSTVYAVHELAPKSGAGGDVASFRFNKKTGTLTPIDQQPSKGDHPCHVELDRMGKWLFASNYSSGTLSSFQVNKNGKIKPGSAIQHPSVWIDSSAKALPHVHGAVMNKANDQLLVTDLGIDKIMLYDFDQTKGITPSAQPFIAMPLKSGPRLLTLDAANRFAYSVQELAGTVSVFRYADHTLEHLQTISTKEETDSRYPASADIHLSHDGRFLYASNRATVNSIAIFKVDSASGLLERIGIQSVGINTPRNFTVDPSGKFLLCANQGTDDITIFLIDRQTGLLTDTHMRIPVGKPVCLKWITKN